MTYKPRDHFYQKAKEEKYKARSVYKLKEINDKFRIIKSGDSVLDLGSSPGSWLQYILEVVKGKGFAAGVDIKEIKGDPGSNCKFIKNSIYNLSDEDFKGTPGMFDVITSDMAPATTGMKDVDSEESYNLCQAAFEICKTRLKKNGNFICKIFQSEQINMLIAELKKSFGEVKRFKPQSSRKISTEIFLVCRKFGP